MVRFIVRQPVQISANYEEAMNYKVVTTAPALEALLRAGWFFCGVELCGHDDGDRE